MLWIIASRTAFMCVRKHLKRAIYLLPQPHAEVSFLRQAVKGVDFTHGIKDLTATAEQRIRSERHFTSTLLVLEHTRSGLSQFKNPFLTNRDTETDSLFRRTRIPLSYVRVLVCTSTCPATISVNWWFCETATCNRVFLFFFFIKAHLE